MRHPDLDFMFVMERRRDELAHAAHHRLVKEAVAANPVPAHRPLSRMGYLRDALILSLARFLSLTGGWMLNWSCRLQTRYEMLKEGVTEKHVSPC